MRVLYVCHVNSQEALGGVRVFYRHVDALNGLGIPSAIVHGVPGHRCTWFTNDTTVLHPDIELGPGDVLAFPEVFATRLHQIAPGIPKVIINQNAHYAWHGVVPTERHPYVTADDLVGVTAISNHNKQLLETTFPGLAVHRLSYSLSSPFVAGPSTRERRVCYMPRKRPQEAIQVLGALTSRGALEGWEVVALSGMTESQVAAELRRAALFLSFSELEGCPLPPLEAIASGCSVIGYTGYGAAEYFDPRFTVEVPDGDILGFIEAADRWLRAWPLDNRLLDVSEAQRYVREMFSPERERDLLIDFFQSVDTKISALPAATGVLRRADTVFERPARTSVRALAQQAVGAARRSRRPAR